MMVSSEQKKRRRKDVLRTMANRDLGRFWLKQKVDPFHEICGKLVGMHRYRGRKYPNSFVGKEAVNALLKAKWADSRDDVVHLCRAISDEFNIFEGVTRDYTFKDENLLYQFTDAEDWFSFVSHEFDALLMYGEANDHDEESKLLEDGDAISEGMATTASLHELLELAVQFENGVRTKTHKYHFKSYPDTFVASEAVTYMVNEGLAWSRDQAVYLARRMAEEFALFTHCCGDHEFKDERLFFCYVDRDKRPDPNAVYIPEEMTLEEIGLAFEKNVRVKTNTYRLRKYRNTFVGSQAVSFLVKSKIAKSRADAVQIGLRLQKRLNLFEHVTGKDHDFKDMFLFYRYVDENSRVRTVEEDADDEYDFDGQSEFNISDKTQHLLLQLVEDKVDVSELGRISTLMLEQAVDTFRHGVKVRTRKYRLTKFPFCFVGSEACDFMVNSSMVRNRREAVKLGRVFAEKFNLFYHVTRSHEFRDDYLFYRFTDVGDFDVSSSVAAPPSERDSFTENGSEMSGLSYFYANEQSALDAAKAFEREVPVGDNRWRLRVYKNTFVGREALDHLVKSGMAKNRQQALRLGRALAREFNLFDHVAGEHRLEDDYLFYRFTNPAERRSWDLHDPRLAGGTLDVIPDLSQSVKSTSTVDSVTNKIGAFEKKILRIAETMSMRKQLENRLKTSPSVGLNTYERARYWATEFRRLDPRYKIMTFFDEIAQDGADRIEQNGIDRDKLRLILRVFRRATVFTVWRPTSIDAIRQLMLGEAVGKGLDIKGKSAKRGKLSSFVPFLQISENRHKSAVRRLPRDGKVRLYFRGENARRSRDSAAYKLDFIADEMVNTVREAKSVLAEDTSDEFTRLEAMKTMLLDMKDPSITYIDNYAPACYGMEIPVRLLWEACVMQNDISRRLGSEYDTGRPSQPAFQDLNFAALRNPPAPGSPRPVLLQHDDASPLNPFELLMAYEEHGRVKPVVSDFDCFLVGTRGVRYQAPLAPDQVDVLKWCISEIETILQQPSGDSWVSRWIDVVRAAAKKGFHPKIPRMGFGDPKSYSMMEYAVQQCSRAGAVRHGAESFNYTFPQDVDDRFLIISDHKSISESGLTWRYVDKAELQTYLSHMIDEGFTFPMNPKWILCDPGWKELYDKLLSSTKPNVQDSMDVWYPPGSGVRERIDAISASHPLGFQKRPDLLSGKRASSHGNMKLLSPMKSPGSPRGRMSRRRSTAAFLFPGQAAVDVGSLLAPALGERTAL